MEKSLTVFLLSGKTSSMDKQGPRLSDKKSPKRWWKVLGPGIVSGASYNDPTTVASLAVIGSTTVYALGWLVLLIIPMLSVVQAVSAQVGVVTKTGLEAMVRRRYGRGWALLALLSVLIVNLVTLAADLEGGGARLWRIMSRLAGPAAPAKAFVASRLPQ